MALTPPPAAPDAPGDAPSRANPSTFRALADSFVLWMVGLQAWLETFITWADTNRTELDALQADVTTKQSTASTAASTATTASSAATAAAAAVAYIYPGTYGTAPTLRPDGSAIQNGDIYTATAGTSYRRASGAWASFPTLTEVNTTCVPVPAGTTAPGTTAPSLQVGRESKVGSWVRVGISLAWPSHTGTGNLKVTGLTYPAVNVPGHNQVLRVTGSNLSYTAGNQLTALILPGTTEILIMQVQPGGVITAVPMDTNVSGLSITGDYEI